MASMTFCSHTMAALAPDCAVPPRMAAARTVFPVEAKLRQMVAAGDMSQQEFDSLLAGGIQ